MRKIKVK